jgi:hypothetical protein
LNARLTQDKSPHHHQHYLITVIPCMTTRLFDSNKFIIIGFSPRRVQVTEML